MNERPGGCGAGEGSGRRARVRGPKDPRRPWKGEERRSTRPVAEGGGAAGGERRRLRAAAPLWRKLLRVRWAARRSNKSIPKEINPE